MQKIGIISDTHMPSYNSQLDEIIKSCFDGCELIIHAGDLVCEAVIDAFFAAGKKIMAVAGNMDDYQLKNSLPLKRILEIEEKRIGVIHGWGAPEGIRTRVRREFNDVDIIIHGHSHIPFAGTENGIYFFCPGSPTLPRNTQSNGNVGIITLDSDNIKGEIISL